MPEHSKEQRGQDVGPEALLKNLVNVEEDGLVVVVEGKEHGLELEVVETGMKVVECIV